MPFPGQLIVKCNRSFRIWQTSPTGKWSCPESKRSVSAKLRFSGFSFANANFLVASSAFHLAGPGVQRVAMISSLLALGSGDSPLNPQPMTQ